MTKVYKLNELTNSLLAAAGTAGVVVQSRDGKTMFNVTKTAGQAPAGIEGWRKIKVQRQGSSSATSHNTTADAVAFMKQY